jgi:hypothetical protein
MPQFVKDHQLVSTLITAAAIIAAALIGTRTIVLQTPGRGGATRPVSSGPKSSKAHPPTPQPQPNPTQIVSLASLIRAQKVDGGDFINSGNLKLRGVSIGGESSVPNSASYAIARGDAAETDTLAVIPPPGSERLVGIFGIDRARNQCAGARASLQINNDSGQLWPRNGRSANVRVASSVRFSIPMIGITQVKFLPAADIGDSECSATNGQIYIALGNVRFVTRGRR